MSVAALDSGYFDEKLQDPWALLLQPSFSCKRNFRTLVQSNSTLIFFDYTFQFHHFSIETSCCFLEGTVWITIFFSFVERLGSSMATRNIQFEKCKIYPKMKEYIHRLHIQQ